MPQAHASCLMAPLAGAMFAQGKEPAKIHDTDSRQASPTTQGYDIWSRNRARIPDTRHDIYDMRR